MRVLISFVFVLLLVSGCGSNSIFIGETEFSEYDLKQIISGVAGTVQLKSAHESDSVVKEGPKEYPNLVVVTEGRIRIANKIFRNDNSIVLNILTSEFFAPGESREIGTDYFVYVVPAHTGQHFEVVVSKLHPDWIGYFSKGNGDVPRGYSSSTWRLLGYFHLSPQGGVLRNSVVTNENLYNPPPGVPLPGMVKVDDFAIDIYENSEKNGHCVSMFGQTPLTGLTCDNARMMAELEGKRLPISRQWIQACDPDTFPQILSSEPKEDEGAHNIWSGQVAVTGYFAKKNPDNISSTGCVDMIGNVSEWCEEVIDFTHLDNMPVKASGYITETTKFSGIPNWPSVIVKSRPVASLGYFTFDNKLSSAGIIRGASCAAGDQAGVYSMLLNVPREQSSPRIGFRCVR